MEPTLLVGDRIFVSKYTYGYSKHSFPFSPSKHESRIFNKNPKQGYFGKIIALLFTKQWLGTFLFCFFFGMLMALMGKQKAQGADHWWEWLWFFYFGGIKSFIAFGFFYFILAFALILLWLLLWI